MPSDNIKFWNIYLERLGMGILVAKPPEGKSSYNARLQDMMDNLQAKTAWTIPRDVELEILESKRNASISF